MTTTLDFARDLLAWGRNHPELLVAVGLGLTVLLLLWTVRGAIRSGRPDKWLARLSFLVGFAWSGEAMWEVATQKLGLSHVFAGFAFFLFESQMATAMMRAERHQAVHQYPGRHGRAVWLIAVVAGLIAAMAGDSPVEVGLRLAVPVMVAYQWWVGLTGDGSARPADAIAWAWTPRRVLVTLGLARPGEQDLKAVDRERQVRAIAVVSHRLHSTSSSWRRSRCQVRLRRLAMHADDSMLDAARVRVERVWQAAERTRPGAGGRVPAVEAEAARAEAGAVRAELEVARAAEAEAVAAAEAAAGHAEAEACRRTAVEAEVRVLRGRVEVEAAGRVKAQTEAEANHAEAEAVRAEAEANRAQAETARAEAETTHAEAAAVRAEAEAARDRAHEAEVRASHALGQVAELRQRLAEAQTRPRARRAATSTGEPVMFDGVPVPEVTGVGAATVLAVLRARRDNPADTQKQLARRVGVSDRTVRQVLAAVPGRELVLATA